MWKCVWSVPGGKGKYSGDQLDKDAMQVGPVCAGTPVSVKLDTNAIVGLLPPGDDM
jgi:hypothetical protein